MYSTPSEIEGVCFKRMFDINIVIDSSSSFGRRLLVAWSVLATSCTAKLNKCNTHVFVAFTIEGDGCGPNFVIVLKFVKIVSIIRNLLFARLLLVPVIGCAPKQKPLAIRYALRLPPISFGRTQHACNAAAWRSAVLFVLLFKTIANVSVSTTSNVHKSNNKSLEV